VPLNLLSTNAISEGGAADVTGVVTTALPATLDVNASAPWRITFTNNRTTPLTGVSTNVFGSSFNSTCTTTLSNQASNNSCYVEGTLTASSAGNETVSATLHYSQGSPITKSTTTTASGASSGLVCTAAVPLAPETLINTLKNPVTLLCTNKSGDDITITRHTTNYPNSVADGTFTPGPGGDNCTAQVLAHNASCQLNGTYVAPGTAQSNVTIELMVDYQTPTTMGLSSQTSTVTDVVTVINNSRIFNLVNNCNFDVWWSMVGGAVSNSPVCPASPCPTGSTCVAKTCYYNNYGPTTGSYMLANTNGTASTKIIQTDASTLSDAILWKGVISASTKCSGTSCQNNACQNNGGTTSCAPGVGFGQPATEAEFTLKLEGATNVDSYDISNVNGFSMPVSMGTNPAATNYTCGTAGNHLASGDLKACDFSNVTPPTNMYFWVTDTGTACTASNSCSNNSEICGLAFDSSTNGFKKNCGDFLGFWAANQICQTEPTFSSPFGDGFHCKQHLSTPFPSNTYTLTQLLKCSPPSTTAPLFNSCYLSYTGATSTELQQCCGCTNWSGIANPTSSCPTGQVDPQWTQYVLDKITWMKQACPTSYAYPYDDKASSFTCTAAESTEYTVTFCPGGGTGLPANKTDGRLA